MWAGITLAAGICVAGAVSLELVSRSLPQTVVALDAHIRLAAPSRNNGIRILRRGYSFTDGMDTRLGQLDAGLFFIS
jgi:deferrochelatase/peroxidase EfeB